MMDDVFVWTKTNSSAKDDVITQELFNSHSQRYLTGKYGHNGILYTRGSIYLKKYLIAIMEV